jgi:hypothetical protein
MSRSVMIPTNLSPSHTTSEPQLCSTMVETTSANVARGPIVSTLLPLVRKMSLSFIAEFLRNGSMDETQIDLKLTAAKAGFLPRLAVLTPQAYAADPHAVKPDFLVKRRTKRPAGSVNRITQCPVPGLISIVDNEVAFSHNRRPWSGVLNEGAEPQCWA